MKTILNFKKVYKCCYAINYIEELNILSEEKDFYICLNSHLDRFKIEKEVKGQWKIFKTFEKAKEYNYVYWASQIEKEIELQKIKLNNLKKELEIANNKELLFLKQRN